LKDRKYSHFSRQAKIDWQGIKQIHTKRGFATKREALEYEREFLASKSRDLNMLFESFVEIYYQN